MVQFQIAKMRGVFLKGFKRCCSRLEGMNEKLLLPVIGHHHVNETSVIGTNIKDTLGFLRGLKVLLKQPHHAGFPARPGASTCSDACENIQPIDGLLDELLRPEIAGYGSKERVEDGIHSDGKIWFRVPERGSSGWTP
jgi:hypothetical protein